MKERTITLVLFQMALLLVSCATPQLDYTNFRQHRPRSILVLPPLNNSTDIRGTYGYLSTVARPLAEMGYYVFPVAMVDEFLKENGLPGPGEMHQAPLDKFATIFGADSVLYITIDQYGTKYGLLNSATIVQAKATLLDARTGLLLWQGHSGAQINSNNGGGGLIGALVSAAVSQAINSAADTAHDVSRVANYFLFTGRNGESAWTTSAVGAGGPMLLYGPYHPQGTVDFAGTASAKPIR